MQPEVKIISKDILSDNWYTLYKVTYEYKGKNNRRQIQSREAYDRGNGAAILLYNPATGNVILTRQFRLPSYINGNSSGMLIEACAGLLDENNPEECIRRETEEETGFRIGNVRKAFDAYMSPGSVTEILHMFVAEYNPEMKISGGGGLEEEQEEIEVLELPIDQAMAMIESGEIKDGKTIMLLQYVKLHGLL
ncbi:nudix-type nucleoside diphosphatase (YffH/AdpP family) [Chitinophaga terrae (ex Kim and Jung 2007)]|uniref:GDP-mannose pyrophosphatase NudK n=1 Tax=Chitinophaga terrae (ex Kim and Jung 2007) TaxID=408074 RepID=UPI002780FD25|nr:GDP-mannose pyrophosphatase NudK [Chitinophaga terrae (ex Kim and Jung 2007)]MDQ0107432.1 nudix-type nucleoside diphosphatase (YffH/AdpP family) [Chitinophaga terrae (ex Kim and Jung 2007)]